MRKQNLLTIFLLIFLLAFAVRGYKLGEIPNGVNGDEAAFGYNAYSILKTGRDEHGVSFPIIRMQSFGDYKATLYSYVTIPGIALFGLNPTTTRFPAAFFGALSAGVMFLVTRKFFGSTMSGVVGGLLFALSPWHVYISRTAHESVLALFFVMLGLWLLLEKGRERNYFFLAAISMVASSFSYNGTRLFPYVLFGLFTLFAYRAWEIPLRRIVVTFLVFGIVILAIFGGSVRFLQTTNVFYAGSKPLIEGEVRSCEQTILPKKACRLIFNKATIIPWMYGRELVAHYNLSTLFISGIPGGGIYSLSDFGLFYAVEAPFFIFGLATLFRVRFTHRLLLILLMLLSPLSSALTTFGNAGRMLLMLPGIIAVTAWGWTQVYLWVRQFPYRQFVPYLFLLLSLLLFGWSAIQFAGHYALKIYAFAGRDFKDGFQRVIPTAAEKGRDFEEIWISRYFDVQPYIFTAFYNVMDPRLVQQAWQGPLNENGRITRLGKYKFFLGYPPPEEAMQKENLVVVHEHEYSGSHERLIATTYSNEGRKQFYILPGDVWKQE